MALPLAFRKPAPSVWVPTNLGNQTVRGNVVFRQDGGQSYSLTRCNNVSDSFRMECRGGDFAPGETDRIRSELQFTDKQPYNTDLWMAWSFRVNANPIPVLWNSCVLGQLHQTEDAGDASGFPPFEMNLHSDGLYVFTATNPTAIDPAFYARTQRAGPIPFTFNVIHAIVIKIRFSWLGAATLDIWLDGVLICSVSGVSIGMNDVVGPYLKLGAYYRVDNPADYLVQQIAAEYWYIVPPTTRDLSDRIANPPVVRE